MYVGTQAMSLGRSSGSDAADRASSHRLFSTQACPVSAAHSALLMGERSVGVCRSGLERAVAGQHTVGVHRGVGHTVREINQAPLLAGL